MLPRIQTVSFLQTDLRHRLPRQRALPWLGVGWLVFWGGQRWLRDTLIGAEQRVVDASLAILLGLVALGIWAVYQQTGQRAARPQSEARPNSRHGIFGIGTGLAALLILVSVLVGEADTRVVAGLRLGALLLFLLAGRPWSEKWTWHAAGQYARNAGIGLALTGCTLGVHLLLTPPSTPAWDLQASFPTLLGDLYRILGSQRSVLVPFALVGLWPASVWWICRRLAPAPWALCAGLLAVLSPFQIWQPLWATQWGLAPFVLLFVVGTGIEAVSVSRPGSWFWLGLGLGLLWVEASPWHILILIGILVLCLPLFVIPVPGTRRPGWMQGLYATVGIVAGLLLYFQASLGAMSGLLPGTATAAWTDILYPPRILAFWFQPGMLELPYEVTNFLLWDGLLVLLGLVLVLTRIRYWPLPAAGGLIWVGGLMYASQDPQLFMSLAHLTAVVPCLLVTVTLAVLMPRIRQLTASVLDGPITDWGLAAGMACLFLWQLPGGVLGFNPLMELRAQMMNEPEEPPARVEPVTVGSFVGESAQRWPATLVWQTAGTCHEGTPVMVQPLGTAIDLASRRVYVVGGSEPGMLVALDMDQDGQALVRWTGELQEPVEVAVRPDGTLRILDAWTNGVWTLNPVTSELSMLTGGQDIYRPRGFQVLPDGQMLVAATGSNRIVRYGADGSWLEDFGSWPGSVNLEQPTDVLSIGDRLWVVAPQQSWLREMYSGLQLEVTEPSYTQAGPHMAALANGSFLLTDSEAGRILHMRADGALEAVVDLEPALQRPVDIDTATDAQGIWMAVTDTGLCRVSLWQLDAGHIIVPDAQSETP